MRLKQEGLCEEFVKEGSGKMLKYRPLIDQDANNYRNIRLEALNKSPESFATSFEEEQQVSAEVFQLRLKAEGATTLGVFHSEDLIGVVTLLFEQKQKLKHRATLVAMYVQPDHQGKGMGRELLQYAITFARKKQGIEQIYLTVVSTNDRAKRLYESLGFRCYGVDKRALKRTNETYADEDMMVLDLKENMNE
ncbi:GNAT family N-acetyltransferase [Alkalihalobacillus sp. FSL W8-0930]